MATKKRRTFKQQQYVWKQKPHDSFVAYAEDARDTFLLTTLRDAPLGASALLHREFDTDEIRPEILQAYSMENTRTLDSRYRYALAHKEWLLRENAYDPMRSYVDAATAFELCYYWRKYKAIYRFGKDFINTIDKDNVDVNISVEELRSMVPYDTIYLDLSRTDLECAGLIVHIHENTILKADKEEVYILVEAINRDYSKPVSQEIYTVSNDRIADIDIVAPTMAPYYTPVVFACLRSLMIQKPEDTECTVHRYMSHVGKVQECHEWDCTMRTVPYHGSSASCYDPNYVAPGTGTPKRPHTRRGFWRRVHVGHGDTKHVETRWIHPTYVNCKDASQLPTVVHVVEE